MKRQNPRKILVTGASGFVGRNILEDLCQDYYIYALARRTQQEADVKTYKNIKWILVDIAHQSSLADVYGDWCEYGLLYILLKTWLSSSWRSRIIVGNGESAVPYIHVNCVTSVISLILEKSDHLSQFDIYLAGPNGATSHTEFFDMAPRYYFGEIKTKIFSIYARPL